MVLGYKRERKRSGNEEIRGNEELQFSTFSMNICCVSHVSADPCYSWSSYCWLRLLKTLAQVTGLSLLVSNKAMGAWQIVVKILSDL